MVLINNKLLRSSGLLCVLYILPFFPFPVQAVTGFGSILDNEEAQTADMVTLQNEAMLFQSIRMGIALSLAQCEGVDLCSPTVNKDEIDALIKTLDERINTLTLRQEEVESPDVFDEILSTYVNERETYAVYMEKIENLTGELEAIGELPEEPIPTEDEFLEPVVSEQDLTDELSEFEDLELSEDDEELVDDEVDESVEQEIPELEQ